MKNDDLPKDWADFTTPFEQLIEIIPWSFAFDITTIDVIEIKHLLKEEKQSFLLNCMRYQTRTDSVLTFAFRINNRTYGPWEIYGPVGTIPIYPPLLLVAESNPQLYFKKYRAPIGIRLSLDGQITRRLENKQ